MSADRRTLFERFHEMQSNAREELKAREEQINALIKETGAGDAIDRIIEADREELRRRLQAETHLSERERGLMVERGRRDAEGLIDAVSTSNVKSIGELGRRLADRILEGSSFTSSGAESPLPSPPDASDDFDLETEMNELVKNLE